MIPYHYSYVLDGHEPVPADDSLSGVQWKLDHPEQSRVAATFLGDGVIGIYTDFLAINHNFERTGPPILFETMIRDERTEEWWGEQWRCATWTQAEAQHERACEYARRTLAGEPVEDEDEDEGAPRHIGALLEGFLAANDEKT